MTTFFTDTDLIGAGEFVEAEVSIGIEYTLPAGSIPRFRWRFPAVAPSVTPAVRWYTVAGTLVATVPFDTTTLDAENWATPGAAETVTAGTYVAAVNTTRYPALGGFFGAGPITRGDITAVQGRFTSGVAFPSSTSTATYYVDIDFTADLSPDTGLGVTVWDGSAEVAATVTVWDGSTEVAASVSGVAP